MQCRVYVQCFYLSEQINKKNNQNLGGEGVVTALLLPIRVMIFDLPIGESRQKTSFFLLFFWLSHISAYFFGKEKKLRNILLVRCHSKDCWSCTYQVETVLWALPTKWLDTISLDGGVKGFITPPHPFFRVREKNILFTSYLSPISFLTGSQFESHHLKWKNKKNMAS